MNDNYEPREVDALATIEAWPNMRRQQILQGRVERGHDPLLTKTRSQGTQGLSSLVRRRRTRVADHRLEQRYPAPSKLREMAIDGRPTAVLDISNSGIRLGSELAGTIGDAVVLDFPGFEAIPATIVWSAKDATGLALPTDAIGLVEAA